MMTEKRIPREQRERELIIADNGSCIVLASAGSGKTTILVEKLIKEAEKEIQHFNYVAITFTNKAATEVKERLSNKHLSNAHATTIDGFLESEILRNFIKVKYPSVKEYNQSYESKYKMNSYDDLINLIIEEKILGSYTNKKEKNGRNFKFELALNLIEEFKVVQEYIKFKYKMIFIDEYQDCDQSMNNLFIYLKDNLNIRLFIVGDIKQSIYQWRGASPRYLEELTENESISTYTLIENFRSQPSIVDYSLAISKGFIVDILAEDKNVYYYNPTDNLPHKEIISMLIEKGIININDENIILGGSNVEIENLYNQLSEEIRGNFTYIRKNSISHCPNKLILEGIAKYYFNTEYNQYDFVEGLDIDISNQDVQALYEKLNLIKGNLNEENIIEIFNFLGMIIEKFEEEEETKILIVVIRNHLNSTVYNPVKEQNMIMTTHASKGLEADNVIIFTEYYFDKYSNILDEEKNYVGITRAKNKLILVDNGEELYKYTVSRLIHTNNSNQFNFHDFIEEIN